MMELTLRNVANTCPDHRWEPPRPGAGPATQPAAPIPVSPAPPAFGRVAPLAAIPDAAPASAPVRLPGKRLARLGALLVIPAVLMLAGMGVLVLRGDYLFAPGPYGRILFQLQRPDYHAPADGLTDADRRAAYERRYGKYRHAPQPRLTGATLRVELYPAAGRAEVRGTYQLVNRSGAPIDTVHLLTQPGVETAVHFDRPFRGARVDAELGHRSYALARTLRPGDSLRLHFTVQYRAPRLPLDSPHTAVADNGSYFSHLPPLRPDEKRWLPLPGYQPARELSDPGARRARGLPPRPAVRSRHGHATRGNPAGRERVPFEAVIGTDAGRVAGAPGTPCRTWTADGRRYFHYVTDDPVRNGFPFFAARYGH